MDIEKIQKFITSAESLKRKVTTESAATFIEASLYVTKEFIAEITALQDRLRAAEEENKQLKESLFSQTSYTREIKRLWLDATADRDRLQSIVDEAQGQEPVAYGLPNTRITEKDQFMALLVRKDHVQYPELLVPLYALPPIPAKQVQYQAACSGLWYSNPKACGEVSSIKIDDVIYRLQSHQEPKQSVEISGGGDEPVGKIQINHKGYAHISRCGKIDLPQGFYDFYLRKPSPNKADVPEYMHEVVAVIKNLMDWQVKNVEAFDNYAYNDAAKLLKKLPPLPPLKEE